jgi:hypothetical protein
VFYNTTSRENAYAYQMHRPGPIRPPDHDRAPPPLGRLGSESGRVAALESKEDMRKDAVV